MKTKLTRPNDDAHYNNRTHCPISVAVRNFFKKIQKILYKINQICYNENPHTE